MEQVDGIRLREFQQLKKEIRGSNQYLIVGIDVGKEKHNAFFGKRRINPMRGLLRRTRSC